MARGRLILRSLGSSRKFADTRARAGKLGEFAQTLYPLLVANSDDFGRLSGDAFTVKHAVFPTSPRTEADFTAALEAMRAAGIILRYLADDGTEVVQIVDFDRGQPNLHKRTASRFPEFSGNLPEIPSQLKGIELKRTKPNSTAPCAGDGFADFWTCYPKKKNKSDADKAWKALAPNAELCQRILEAVEVQRTSKDWRKDGGQFIPYPASWLRARRWEDDEPGAIEPEREDWYDECRRLHGGACGLSSDTHRTRMLLEAEKAASA